MGTTKPLRVARYLRCSRSEQNVHLQEDETAALIEKRGWTLAGTYKDEGVSGTRERRPGLDRLMADVRKGKIDAVLVWRADRLFRSLKNMVNTLDEWQSMGVGFVSACEIFDSTTPQGRLIMQLAAAFAEFERSIIADRVRSGIAAARRRGARIGRPRARFDEEALRDLKSKGMSVREIGKALGIGSSTVQRRLGRLGLLGGAS
jgi:DNA invertase Pin-like site-specific DNA recombinase